MPWRVEPITRQHDRASFDCGEKELNDYLQRHARQNHDAGGAKTFVAVPPEEPQRIDGYYSISPASVDFERVPQGVLPRIGRYPVPVYRLARLAVDRKMQGQGLGEDLLFDAGARALAVADSVGGVALLIDAKSDRAAAWYRRLGAVALVDNDRELLLSLETVRAVIDAAASA